MSAVSWNLSSEKDKQRRSIGGDARNGRSKLVSSAVIQPLMTWRSDVAKPPTLEGPVMHSFSTTPARSRISLGMMS